MPRLGAAKAHADQHRGDWQAGDADGGRQSVKSWPAHIEDRGHGLADAGGNEKNESDRSGDPDNL